MSNNKQQDAIIESNSKRIVVLACPGSGKTTTLTKKIIKLYNNGESLKRILSVTFTRKAAQEMFKRISKEIPVSRSEQRNICTLHSLGCRLLFAYKDLVGLKEDYSVAVKSEKVEIVKEVFSNNDLPDEIVGSFLSFVSSIKNGFVLNNGNFTQEQFEKYSSLMISKNLIDIDDYIYLPVKILSSNEIVRSRVSNRYDYIYVDEYQDINKIQNDFLDLLINDKTSVLYVGDDDQSIYEFRGSDPNYILEKSSPESGFDVYYLTTNYRSQKTIVDLSKKVLTGLSSLNRREKTIIANKTNSKIKPIRNHPFPSKEDEIQYVVNEIYRLISESNVEPKEIAVLCRFTSKKNYAGIPTHPELLEIGNRLKAKGISASSSLPMEDDTNSSKKIKELCNFLIHLNDKSLNPKLCNLVRENAYVEKRFVKLVDLINQKYSSSIDASDSFESCMDNIIELDAQLDDKHFQNRLETLINIYSFCKEQFDAVHNGALPSEIISNLISFAAENGTIQDSIKDVYEYAVLFSQSAENEYEPDEENESEFNSIVKTMEAFLYEQDKNVSKNCVRLLTAHQSKGLQFDVVFVVGLEAGHFPCNIEKLDGQNLDNERRLFYVCITRARELLYLSSTGYAIEENKDLADKTFIYNLPETYFDNKISDFSSIDFTFEENDSMSRQIRASERIIDQLESDRFVALTKLREYETTIKLLEQKNRDLRDGSAEYEKNQKIIEALRKNVSILNEELEGKNTYLELLKERIEKLNEENKNLKNELSTISNNNNEEEKQKLLSLLEKNNEEKEELGQKLLTMIAKVQKAEADNEKLKKEIEQVKKQSELSNITNSVNRVVSENSRKASQSKNEFIYDCVLNFPNDIVNTDIKNALKRLFDIIVIKKKYPRISSYFETGLSQFQDAIEASREYINSNCDQDVFVGKLRSASYKTNIMVLVRKMLEVKTNSSVVLGRGKEFYIYPFLCEYMRPSNNNSPASKMAKNYSATSNNGRKMSMDLAERLKTSYVVSTVANHEPPSSEEGFKTDYSRIYNDFINHPSTKYYGVMSAVFEFIDLHINDDLLMFHVKNLWFVKTISLFRIQDISQL